MNSKELRSKALAKITEARSVEDNAAAIALMDEAKALNERAAKLEEVEAIEAELSTPVEARNLPDTKAEVRKETKEDAEERDFISYLKGEKRAQSVAVAADGGITVPTTIAKDLVVSAVDYGPMLDSRYFTVYNTSAGNPITYATRTASRRARPIREAESATELTGKLGSVTIGAHKLATDLAVASNELLTDSAIDVRKWLVEELAESAGLGMNYELTRGVGGADNTTGICTALAPTAKAVALPTDEATRTAFVDALLDLQYEVNSTYRKRGHYMISSAAELEIRKLKDKNGNYIWQESARAGEPATIHGKPYIINDDMDFAADEVAVIFGDMKSFYTRVTQELSIKQVNDASLTMKDQIGWLGFVRVDGAIVQAKGLAALKGASVAEEDEG